MCFTAQRDALRVRIIATGYGESMAAVEEKRRQVEVLMIRNLLIPIFRLAKHRPLPFVPIGTINMSTKDTPASPAPHRKPEDAPKANEIPLHSNQLSS
jgi:hypothetical protein